MSVRLYYHQLSNFSLRILISSYSDKKYDSISFEQNADQAHSIQIQQQDSNSFTFQVWSFKMSYFVSSMSAESSLVVQTHWHSSYWWLITFSNWLIHYLRYLIPPACRDICFGLNCRYTGA